MKILVIAAHPDDEVLGCGGTVARLNREGHEVYFSIMAEGITSRYEHRDQAEPSELTKLHADCRKAAAVLGAREVFFHGLPDNRMDTVPLLDVIKIVEDNVKRLQPHRIYTHHGGDLNVDHGVVHRAVLTATRPTKQCPVQEVYAFEVPSSTEWAFQRIEPLFRANTFVDITSTIQAKIEAMRCYETESCTFPHPRSPESLRAVATRWGGVVGCAAAEAFELVRLIRREDGL